MRITKMVSALIDENVLRGWALNSVIVSVKDNIIKEYHKYPLDTLYPQYSITKAFTAIAIGILCDRTLIDINEKISEYIPEIHNNNNLTLKEVKVLNLLTNTAGNNKGYLFEADRHSHNTDDYLNLILNTQLPNIPGERFCYSNSNYYLLSRIIENVTKARADKFIIDNIFKPLDILNYRVTLCPHKHFLGGSGLFLSTRDMIKLGMMIALKGTYEGKRVISNSFLKDALSPVVRINSKESYGYSFMMKDLRSAYVSGNYNQLLLIDKLKDLVVAVNSDVRPSMAGTLMKLVRRTIINNY